MSLVYACSGCSKDMVLLPMHRGRTVPCPHCGGATDVPANLTFDRALHAAAQDAAAGRRLLGFAVVSLMVPILAPIACLIWWAASGRLSKAEEEEREPEPLLRLARGVSIAAVLVGSVIALGWISDWGGRL